MTTGSVNTSQRRNRADHRSSRRQRGEHGSSTGVGGLT